MRKEKLLPWWLLLITLTTRLSSFSVEVKEAPELCCSMLYAWKWPKGYLGVVIIQSLFINGPNPDLTFLLYDHFTGCNLTELWNLPTANATFLSDVSSLNDTATRYPSCDVGSVGSTVLVNTTLNTATVAYYTGTTSGSMACFVCEDGYELSTTTSERFCRRNGLWSGNPIICGMSWCANLYSMLLSWREG